MEKTIKILSFDPLQLEYVDPEPYQGKVHIKLPPVHYQLYDMSLGGLLPGAHIGADLDCWRITITTDTTPLSAGEITQLVIDCLPQLKEAHATIQADVSKQGCLQSRIVQ